MIIPALFLDDLLQHIRGRSARYIFVQEYNAVGFLQRLDDLPVNIERQ